MLGNLFTMLCVNDADGRAVRDDFKSSVPNDVFKDEAVTAATDDAADPDDNDEMDVDGDPVGGGSGTNADDFIRLLSNDSLPL